LPADVLKVGLVWAGRAIPRPTRTVPLQMLSALAQLDGVAFVSLQMGPAADEYRKSISPFRLLDWTDELHDFADTAALIDNLDLVLTIDTAVAHLAGAMGKPVWLLLEFAADWRWMLDASSTPWYPTMRLFRQPTRGDWESPLRDVQGQLRELQCRK
jgi:hypothetical protein